MGIVINFAGLFVALIIGFIVGAVTIFVYQKYIYHSKYVKQYGFSTREQNKRLAADSTFLKPSKEEHAVNDFK